MERDIFNTLKHDGHSLQVITDNGVLRLGCVTCGVTLISSDKNDLNEILDLYNTLKENKNFETLKGYIRNYITILLIGDKKEFEKYLDENTDAKTASYHLHSYKVLPAGGRNLYTISYKQAESTLEHFDIPLLRFQEHIKDYIMLLKSIATNKGFILKEVGDEPLVISNEEHTMYGYKNEWVQVSNIKVIEEAEAQFPTVKDVYTFKDMDDYKEIEPSWDDLEEWNDKAIVFYYRIKHGLFDYSNLDKMELLKYFMTKVEGYENLEIYGQAIKGAFKIK